MRPMRSMLFVPGHKPSWVEKAWKAEPDGLILDLEDAVPLGHKEAARRAVRAVLEQARPEEHYCVRLNSLASGLTQGDLEAVVHPGLSAVMLPKVYRAEELAELDQALSGLEQEAGLTPGSIATPLLLETAPGMRNAYDIAMANPRVGMILMSAGPGGDAARAIGYQWSKQGTETLYLRSKLVLDARAAGVTPLINSWYDVADLDGLARDARLNRSLGYSGMALIHPSHVAVVNEIFSPTEQDVAFFRGLLAAFEEAERQGHAAVVYEGDMVDYAMAQTAREFLEFARQLGIPAE
jgi:citrate lyase subunit beta/citryl-CoA lyase